MKSLKIGRSLFFSFVHRSCSKTVADESSHGLNKRREGVRGVSDVRLIKTLLILSLQIKKIGNRTTPTTMFMRRNLNFSCYSQKFMDCN